MNLFIFMNKKKKRQMHMPLALKIKQVTLQCMYFRFVFLKSNKIDHIAHHTGEIW